MTDTLKTKIKLLEATMGPHVGTSSVKWSTWRFITLHSNYVTSPSAVLFSFYCFQMAAVASRTTSDEWSRDIQLIIKIKMFDEWTDQDCCYIMNILRTTDGLENREITSNRLASRQVPVFIYINSVALVRERTIPTERPPPVGEVSANFCG